MPMSEPVTTYTIHGDMTITTERADLADEFSRCGLRVTAVTSGE